MAEQGDAGVVTAADLASIRARLREGSFEARSDAVDTMRAWQGARLEPPAADAALRAAGVAYPWVPGVPDDVDALFVQLLWTDPACVEVADLEVAYAFCAERGRRAVLRTLALRADPEALDAVAHLIGSDGPPGLLPVPSADLLAPLLAVPGVQRLASSLVTVAPRRGWAGHVAELLGEMARRGLLDDDHVEEVTRGLSPLVHALTDACDRAAAVPGTGDPGRIERRRLASVVPLFSVLPGEAAVALLRRVLACADPRIAATAAVGLAARREPVGEDRFEVIARDPESRAVLLAGLAPIGRDFDLPGRLHSEVAVAEAHLVEWLASGTQLRIAPDEVEHRGVVSAPLSWGRGVLHVFAFRIRPPHWAASRGWMLGAVGPFDPSAELSPIQADGFAARSLYDPEDGLDIEHHVLAIATTLAAERGDEAA